MPIAQPALQAAAQLAVQSVVQEWYSVLRKPSVFACSTTDFGARSSAKRETTGSHAAVHIENIQIMVKSDATKNSFENSSKII